MIQKDKRRGVSSILGSLIIVIVIAGLLVYACASGKFSKRDTEAGVTVEEYVRQAFAG